MTTAIETADLLPFRDPGFRSNPYPYYRRLREEHPVLELEEGFFVLSRYEDMAKLLRNRNLSVAQLDFGAATPLHNCVLGMDAPRHTDLRKMTNSWFTPDLISTWIKTTKNVVTATLDDLGPDGEIEAVRSLALLPTHTTVCQLLGVSPDGADEIKQRTYDIARGLGAGADEEDAQITEQGFAWYRDHVDELVAYKRGNPGEGMLDELIRALDAGEISEDELQATMLLYFAVGHLDVSYLIANGLRIFIEQPEVFAAYRDHADARPGIINEILRYDAPEQSVVRLATADLEIGGTTVPAGSILLMLVASANRDDARFEHPDQFDFTRPVADTRHLSFSSGPHACAGQALARAEAGVVFDAITSRYQSIELAGEPTYAHTEFVRTLRTLPIRLR